MDKFKLYFKKFLVTVICWQFSYSVAAHAYQWPPVLLRLPRGSDSRLKFIFILNNGILEKNDADDAKVDLERWRKIFDAVSVSRLDFDQSFDKQSTFFNAMFLRLKSFSHKITLRPSVYSYYGVAGYPGYLLYLKSIFIPYFFIRRLRFKAVM